jgi:5-methylcytosine-specific restriction endonuclease McrBC GTP-binding regulatory subunit McrB
MSYKPDPKAREMIPMTSSKNLYDFFSKGFFFPSEILTRYYLSLKTKPFVILSGISGTGKTKIAQLFAEYICQEDSPAEMKKRIAFVPVRPDWMDNKGMLGYYNILDEKYHSTKILDLLIEAKANPEKPYFVILDEMNLAKVEHYFSDFLSILESRTADNPDGEEITLHPREQDIPSTKGADHTIPNSIHIPRNVFFAGTVNIDESTYMFSPKVLDRANVIEFNDVDLGAYETGHSDDKNIALKDPNVLNLFFDKKQPPFCRKNDYEEYLVLEEVKKSGKNYLQELLNILRKYNLHFGYRVANELGRFMVIAHSEIDNFKLNDAFDIQMMQKILPKFHGTKAKLELCP